MQDDRNPNYNAVKDVKAFQLEEGGHLGPCWYFIKVRPGLADFLEEVTKMYELHVYTMGTRAYADAVAKIVDPHRKYFGDRVLSRDESGSMSLWGKLTYRRYGSKEYREIIPRGSVHGGSDR